MRHPAINAVVDHRPDEVLTQADAIDARIAAGEDVGPLGGVAVTIKVISDQKGFATTNGTTLQRDWIATANNPVVDNFLKAGAVILGRTNCPAFSYRWFTNNEVHGHTKNPHDASLTPGGSSGGRGRCDRRRHRPYRAWYGYRGLDPVSCLRLRRAWVAPDARADCRL